MGKLWLVGLVVVSCGGEVDAGTVQAASVECDVPAAEASFVEALATQYREDGALCAEAPQIATCLTPETSCAACQALRCCGELEQCVLSGAGCAAKDACIRVECPVCGV